MSKKKADETPIKDTVTVRLLDEHEGVEHHRFEVLPHERDRVYAVDGVSYEASRQEPDGNWIYRKATL